MVALRVSVAEESFSLPGGAHKIIAIAHCPTRAANFALQPQRVGRAQVRARQPLQRQPEA